MPPPTILQKHVRSGRDSVDSLCAFERYAESHDNFVKNQQHAAPGFGLSKSLQKSIFRGNYAHVASHWLDNRASEGIWILIKMD